MATQATTGKRIGIDIRPYLYDKSGIGRYLFQLTKSLIALDKKNTYVLFADRQLDVDIPGQYHTVIFETKIPKVGSIIYHIRTLLEAKKHCDIYFTATSLYVPAFRKDFAFLVIHDLAMFELPEYHTLKTKILSKIFMRLAVRNAKQIIAVSEYTKKDILKYFPFVDKKRVHVVKEGISDTLYQEIENYDESYWQTLVKKFHVKEPFFMFVGTIQPRKNLIGLIQAFEKLYTERKGTIQLVILGKKGWKNEAFDAHLASLNTKIRKSIILTGFSSDKDKAYLYKHAYAFIYPSFYEGFGIPPLEAMRFSLPVIVSNTSSLPEVVGNSGILIDPYTIDDMYKAMKQLLDDKKLYTSLQKKSLERVAQFNWEDIASSIIQLY